MKDFQLDNNHDLKIANGDFVIADSTDQNVELIFRITPGELKEHLETGVAIDRAINGNIDRFLDRTINVGTTSFDNAANCFIALMYYVNCNFYDFKYTVGHHRYSSNYVPAPLNWADADIVVDQYKTINLPFK